MSITDKTRADLKEMENIRIFFAHQSVGANVLDGVDALAKEGGVNIKIVALDERPVGPGIVHGFAGQNGRPDSKIEFFVSALGKLADRPPQVALMKFCFVDFTPDTDADALLVRYQAAVSSLQRAYPDVALIHVTAPLTTRPNGVKERAYRLLGRHVWADDTNDRRGRFNDRLRSTFGNEPIFDLARLESTRPDGGSEIFTNRAGQSVAALCPAYAMDDGHLNAVGRRLAALEFVRVVVAAAKNRRRLNP